MKIQKVLLASIILLTSMFGTVATLPVIVHAEDSDLQDYVDESRSDAEVMFSDLKDKYNGLANNYGNIEIKSSDDIYKSYLNNIQSSKSSLEIDEKLESIKNTDLSYDNSDLQAEFDKAKTDAAKALSDAKLSSDAIKNKFNTIQAEQTQRQAEIEKERIAAAAKKYNAIAAGYNDVLNKTAPNNAIAKPEGIGSFNASDLKYLSHSMGIDFDKAVTVGKMGTIQNLGMSIVNEASKLFGVDYTESVYSK